MTLAEVEEATEIIHEAAGEDANVILGAVIDEEIENEVMVTVIATGFNRRGGGPARVAKPGIKMMEKIPSGVTDLQKLDEPAYVRRGVDLNLGPHRLDPERERAKIDKSDPDKPAFLRKIMD
jgi:cell division protein FtsZ